MNESDIPPSRLNYRNVILCGTILIFLAIFGGRFVYLKIQDSYQIHGVGGSLFRLFFEASPVFDFVHFASSTDTQGERAELYIAKNWVVLHEDSVVARCKLHIYDPEGNELRVSYGDVEFRKVEGQLIMRMRGCKEGDYGVFRSNGTLREEILADPSLWSQWAEPSLPLDEGKLIEWSSPPPKSKEASAEEQQHEEIPIATPTPMTVAFERGLETGRRSAQEFLKDGDRVRSFPRYKPDEIANEFAYPVTDEDVKSYVAGFMVGDVNQQWLAPQTESWRRDFRRGMLLGLSSEFREKTDQEWLESEQWLQGRREAMNELK